MIGLILSVNGYLMSCADDSALSNAVVEFNKFEDILNNMVNDEDKDVIQVYHNKAKGEILSILSFRLQANYGANVVDMLCDIPEDILLKTESVNLYDPVINFDIINITHMSDFYSYKLNVEINDTYISDFAREKTRDIVEILSDVKPVNVIDTVKFVHNKRDLTEKEYKTIALRIIGHWECDRINHIKNPTELDEKLDEVLLEVEKLKSRVAIATDIAGGVYIVTIEVMDGELLDNGVTNYTKYVDEYFIDSDNECHFVGDWDFLKTGEQVETI